MTQYIYALVDPRTEEIRYIGRTNDPELRLRQHASQYSGGANEGKKRWVKELLEANLKPRMDIIETVHDETMVDIREAHWIKYYLQSNASLLNIRTNPTAKPSFRMTGSTRIAIEDKRDLEFEALSNRMSEKYPNGSLNDHLKHENYLDDFWAWSKEMSQYAEGRFSIDMFMLMLGLYEKEDLTPKSVQIIKAWYLKKCEELGCEPSTNTLEVLEGVNMPKRDALGRRIA